MRNSTPLLLVSVLLFASCGQSTPSADFEFEWVQRTRAHLDTYDRQAKRVDEQQAKAEKQNLRFDDLQARAEEQGLRFDDLLDRWEEQARRYDAILDAMEKQQGLKK